MNCPFCKHELETKQTHGGLYGKCHFCRFCGYLPKETLSEVSKDISEILPEWLKKILETPQCPVCDKSCKTKEEFQRHFQKVLDGKEINPIFFESHRKYFSELLKE